MKNPEKFLAVISIASVAFGARRVFSPKKMLADEADLGREAAVAAVVLTKMQMIEPYINNAPVVGVLLAADAIVSVPQMLPGSSSRSSSSSSKQEATGVAEVSPVSVVPKDEEFWENLPDHLPKPEPAKPTKRKVLSIVGLVGQRLGSVLPHNVAADDAALKILNKGAAEALEELEELDTCENAESAAWKLSWEEMAAPGACRAKSTAVITKSIGPVRSLEACAKKCAESRKDSTPSCCELTDDGGCNFLAGDGVFFQRGGGSMTIAACFYRYENRRSVELLKGLLSNFAPDDMPAE